MKYFFIFICAIIWIGCVTTQPSEGTYIPPQLIEKVPLPSIPPSITSAKLEFTVKMQILENGIVGRAELQNSSGNALWDSAAVASFKQWRYSPARYQEKPIKMWISQKIVIHRTEPVILYLAEILCNSKEIADTVFIALKEGKDFVELALQYSISASREKLGILGRVDINRYNETIQNALKKLYIDEFTPPLAFGERYIIFKRMKEGVGK
jgi:TonB family protein